MKKTNIDSPFYRTMGRIGDLVLANVLWLVCSLPIITAGASTPQEHIERAVERIKELCR
jgi:4-hydroxy-3-methylbut-2-enyl diphosphate reductase IspH